MAELNEDIIRIMKRNSDGTITPVLYKDAFIESPDWSFTDSDMAVSIMTYNINFDSDLRPNFGFNWCILFEGNYYYLMSTAPNGTKDQSTRKDKYVLRFGDAGKDLQRKLFSEIQVLENGDEVLTFSSDVAFHGTVLDWVRRVQINLDAHFGAGKFVIDLNPEVSNKVYTAEDYHTFAVTDRFVWDAVVHFNSTFGLHWKVISEASRDVIKVGYPTEEIPHIFEYGGGVSDKDVEGGLLSLNVTFSETDLTTRLYGKGGTENIPLNYFTLTDPDWLTDGEYTDRIGYYRNLLPKSFRMYVMGHNDKRNGDRFTIPANPTIETFKQWHTYFKAYDDGKFSVINFDDACFADESLIDTDWDNMGTMPYAFKAYIKGWRDAEISDITFNPIWWVDSDNISKYGKLDNIAETNSDIKPSIIGVTRPNIGRIDELVDAEQILEEDNTFEKYTLDNIDFKVFTYNNGSYHQGGRIYIPNHTSGNPLIDKTKCKLGFQVMVDALGVTGGWVSIRLEQVGDDFNTTNDIAKGGILTQVNTVEGMNIEFIQNGNDPYYKINIPNMSNIEDINEQVFGFEYEVSESNKRYALRVESDCTSISYSVQDKTNPLGDGTYGTRNGYITVFTSGAVEPLAISPNFMVWIKDIGFDLSDSKYRGTNEPQFTFNTGLLAGEDYNYMVIRDVDGNVQVFEDTSKSLECYVDGVLTTVSSKYRVLLQKSDADLEISGKYLPNYTRNAKGGDFFFIHEIELPFEYLYYAEERYDVYLRNLLFDLEEYKPTVTFELDSQKIDLFAPSDTFKAGNIIRIRNKTLIGGSYITTKINSITKTPTKIESNG